MVDLLEEAKDFDVVCLFGFSQEEVEAKEGQSLIFFRVPGPFPQDGEIYYDGENCDLAAFQELCKEKIFQRFFYVLHPSIAKSEKALFWVEKCKEVEWQCQLSAFDYQDFGVKVFKNLLSSKLVDCSSFSKFKDSLRGVPAFICGAGPSLEKDLPFLEIAKERGVIFAGGAALGYITKKGIPVHIAAGIDPDPDYEKVLMQGSFEAPFFYQSRFSSDCLEAVQGPLFQVPSNPGYELEKWFEEEEVFDGGWTVSTFCAALASYFGCDPIVLIGIDLSYQDSYYAKGIGEGEEVGVVIKEGLSTKRDWILAGKWLEDHLSSKLFYNTSDQGLVIQGQVQKTLADLLKKELSSSYDIGGLIHQISTSWKPSDKKEKLVLLRESIDRCLSLINVLLEALEKYYPEDPSLKRDYILPFFDLQDELFYKKVLGPLWDVWQFPMGSKLLGEYAKNVNRFLFFKRVLEEYRGCYGRK